MSEEIAELLRAEAEYAETHRDAPLRDGTEISHRGQRAVIFSIRLSHSEKEALEAASRKAGIPVSRLARGWIVDRLVKAEQPHDIQEIADALAAYSRALLDFRDIPQHS